MNNPPPQTSQPFTDVPIRCVDGYRLTARMYQPLRGLDQPVTAVIAPATGAKASYYWRYAAFLAASGISAVVADYRGIGRSRTAGSAAAALRQLDVRWHEWGTLDLDAVLGWAHQQQPTDELVVVGHSFGGLAVCLAPHAAMVSRLLMIGAQHAYWLDYDRGQRVAMGWRWHIVMPAVTSLLGYFPGRRIGWLEACPEVWLWTGRGAAATSTARSALQTLVR